MPTMTVSPCLTRLLPRSKGSEKDALEIGSDFLMGISISLPEAHLLLKTS